MTFLKSLLLSFAFFITSIIATLAQSSIEINIQWTGSFFTVQIPNGSYLTVPAAKNAFVTGSGTLVYQLTIPGYLTNIKETSVSYMSPDSASTAFLNKLKITQENSISSVYLYNDVVSTQLYIPILRQTTNSGLSRVSSITLSYNVSYSSTSASQLNKPNYSTSSARTTATGSSVLSQGEWFKLGVSQSGIYRIDAAYLTSIGISPGSIDPKTVQIFGNGGGMLPQANDSSRINDLAEVATYFYDDGNAVFDNSDFILFYAESPNIWQYNGNSTANPPYSHQLDLYSTQNFYFLTYGQNTGKHITSQSPVSGATQTITTYNEHLFQEPELYNIISSGREWYGDQFDQFYPNRTYSFDITGASSTGVVSISALGRSTVPTTFSYIINGASYSQSVAAISTAENAPSGTPILNNYSFPAAGTSTLNISITYLNGGAITSIGNLDFLEVNFEKALQLYNKQTMFRSIKSVQSTSQYNIGNCNGTEMVWDITDPRNITALSTTFASGAIQFSGTSGSTPEEYIILQGSAFANPLFIEKTPNQNLHGLSTPDMIIVTHPSFLSQAQRLQNFRQTNNGLNVEVVTTDQVYNEFSSGKQDVSAIRDFARMLYNASTGTTTLKYLLLFGNGACDYKNILNLNSTFVPVYESRESLNPLQSYCSDDFFTFFDPQEGNWTEGSNPDFETENIGVGRLNVRSPEQGDEVVSKIMSYSVNTSSDMGNWRNKMTLSACDGDSNLHLNNAEAIYSQIYASNKQLNINKIYIDAYQQESTPAGKAAPLVVEAVNLDIEEGTLIWNYVGHGGVGGLAQQGIVTDATINSWTNYNKLPFMITATCDFGRFDTPGLISGAEIALLSSIGGACGLLTSTRTVFSNFNSLINSSFYTALFTRNADGSYPTVGNVMMNTKNTSNAGVYNRNYNLLADPSMTISFPRDNIVITAINNVPVSASPDTLKALSQITLSGNVTDFTGAILSSFNGQANITVYDKPSIITTLGSAGSIVTTFKLQNNIIFNGPATVTNGAFKISFIVPKDISYNYDFGKISLYSQQGFGSLDAGGDFTNIVVGGSNPNAPVDVTPPTVKLYLNDASFVSGGVAGPNPVFFADISDASGINLSTASIGHQITLTMSNSTQVIILNQYYTAALDDFTKGKVQYPFYNLAPGSYTLHFTVWDTYNNSTQESLEFTILNTAKIQLDHVLNYPNPFTTNTTFHFDHNRFGDDLLVQVQVYTVSGIMIKNLEETVYNSPSHISGLSWNGLDEFGSKIGHGVYVYKLKIRSLTDGSTTHVYQKLVLL